MTDPKVRRIKLIKDLLTPFGFEHYDKADYLDSVCTYGGEDQTLQCLVKLGRMTMLTKQLDMALANDAITAWYTQDIRAKLGVTQARSGGARGISAGDQEISGGKKTDGEAAGGEPEEGS